MMSSHPTHHVSDKPLLLAILLLVLVYATATAMGLTQGSTSNAEAAGTVHAASDPHHHETADHGAAGHHGPMPHYYAVAPFVILLGCIAVLPLIAKTEHWWESNLNRFCVAAALAIVTLGYYLSFYHEAGIDKVITVLNHAILQEYIPFIVLLFSLYAISGGIRIEGDLAAHPTTNSMFMVVGGLLASFIGTTGAAMLLIRPLLETNDERKHVQHTVVFFIFIVCNCGGCLLPIGDPPLFLGYLEGVNFLWTMWNLWLPWAVVNAILIAIYYFIDRFVFYPRETKQDIRRDETQTQPLTVTGLWPNALLLIGVILSVALLDPTKPVPGTSWHPWLYLREIVQIGLVGLSLFLGSPAIRIANRFNYHAILEVAALFVGIFICMQPAIEILNIKGPNLGVHSPMKLFWATGGLSAVLDNAPTYLVFFKTASASVTEGDFAALVSSTPDYGTRAQLIGISLGAVFLGAMTYIGNGPNFMVRAIAEQSGVRMPSFFGYVIRYSIPILIPVFLLASFLFLRT